ncbi:MAG: helix-turn-helix domain-containing protein [Opitutales bacterium]|nr:helix-turn-helix domain-containing protein [Opitutales bacterium]
MEKNDFERLKQSLKQMKQIEAGELKQGRIRIVNPENETSTARAKLGMTQEQFAKLIQTPVGTLRGWEQGRRTPPATAKVLMKIAIKHPDAVLDSIHP